MIFAVSLATWERGQRRMLDARPRRDVSRMLERKPLREERVAYWSSSLFKSSGLELPKELGCV
jgi:hypothetical protein